MDTLPYYQKLTLTSVKKSSQSHNFRKSCPALIVPLLLYICKRFSKYLSKHFIILPHILCPLIYASLYIVQHKDGNRKPQVFTPAVYFLLRSLVEIHFRIYRLSIGIQDLEIKMRSCRYSCRTYISYLLSLPYSISDIYIPC